MKKITLIFTMCTILSLLTSMGYAQNQGRFSALGERITNGKLNEIGRIMGLEKAKVEELRPIYHRFVKERASLNDGSLLQRLKNTPDSITNEQAEKLFFMKIDKSRKLLDIREKYYHEFLDLLTPKQILQFQQAEAEVNRKLLQDTRMRIMQRFPGE